MDDVTMVPIGYEDKEIVRQLLELYLYELSEYTDAIEMNASGRFGYRYLDHYWTEESRFPFFIRCEGRLAGFAFVRRMDYNGREDMKWLMAEFFVLRRYRRQGIGKAAALALFRRFPGPWVVGMLEGNEHSAKFWETAIAAHTQGRYEKGRLGSQPALLFRA